MTDISNLNLQITGFVARLCMGDNKHESTFKEIVSILDNIEKTFLQNKLETTEYRKKCGALQQKVFRLIRENDRYKQTHVHNSNTDDSQLLQDEVTRLTLNLSQLTAENNQLKQNNTALEDEVLRLKSQTDNLQSLDEAACMELFNENTQDFS